MSTSTSSRRGKVHKHFTSSIPLWVRNDQPRQTGMDYWRFPHSGIISATPSLEEYRQIHLAEANPGVWPATDGVETSIPVDRKIDGVAEVTFKSALSPLLGRKQTQLAYQDEINVFRRTLLYTGLPGWSHWYEVAPDEKVGARTLVYLRRRDGVNGSDLRKVVNQELVPALIRAGVLKELRTQTFLPWSVRLWDTPNVAHDNPVDQQFHASLILGFADVEARENFLGSSELERISARLQRVASAIHAYDVSEALTFVKNGAILPKYQS